MQSCSLSRLQQAAIAYGLWALLTFLSLLCCISHLTLLHSPSYHPPRHRFGPVAQCPHESHLLVSGAGFLPTSVFVKNPSISTIALSPNKILRVFRPRGWLTMMSLALRLRIMAPRSLRHSRHSSKRCATVCLLPLHHQKCASSALLILVRWKPVIVWPDLSCKYRAAIDFLASLMCLLSFVVGFHSSPTACFTYDSEADRIALGCCLAVRCATVLATLKPLLLMLLGSHVRTTEPLPSPIRLACLFTSVVVRSTVMTRRVTRFTCTKTGWSWYSPDVAHTRVT
jgi:hypothetical protein